MASAAAATPQRRNQAGLARDLGVSRQAISDLIKRQIIPIAADGLIDVEVARMAIASRVRPSGKTNATAVPTTALIPPTASAKPAAEPGADAQLSYHVAKTLREAAEAKIAQLKLAEMRGDLVRADEVRASLAKRAASFREGLLQIPSRLSAQLAAETSQAAVHALLDAELRTVMAQLTAGA
jgi:hypothetical protein